MTVEQLGEVEVVDDGDGPVARVRYLIDGNWLAEIRRELNAPTNGPTAVIVTASTSSEEDGDVSIGGYAGPGLQLAVLRAVPLTAARLALESAWVRHNVEAMLTELPDPFEGEYAYAKLAEVVVYLHEADIRNPVGVIARSRAPHVHGTWATRVKRAKARGFYTDEPVPALTGKSVVLLRS